jgi:acyl-CoA synthetase (AMP-forming)/AMP-acid ligase II
VAAIVELREGQSLDLAGLRTFLSTGLAGYKLPRAMTLVGQVPRNPAGKAQYPRAAELALASDAQRL